MRRNIFRAVSIASLALLAGCASTPPSSFYTLTAVADSTAPSSNLVIVVGPVTVPGTVDRPQMVVAVGANQVQLDEFNRWASPLQDEISVAVAGDLVAYLGTPNVTTLANGDVQGAQYRVSIDVQRFESRPGSAAVVDAAWIVRKVKDGKLQSGRSSVREDLQQPGYGPLAAGQSRAVARVAQDIATAIRSLDGAAD